MATRDPASTPSAITVLAIETSGRGGGVAIVRAAAQPGGEPPRAEAILGGAAAPSAVLAERAIDPASRHGQALLPAIEATLAEAGLEKRDLGLIACGIGPGSYTSLRIGLATGRTLAYALGLPVHGEPSFDVLALGLPEALPEPLAGARSVLVAVDAFRAEVYVGRYRVERGGAGPTLVRIGEIASVPPGEALAGMERPVVVIGDGARKYPEQLAPEDEVRAGSVRLAPAAGPRAGCLGALAASAWLAGIRQSPREVLPLYLRPALPEPGVACRG
jgi:tRNA threonylcarbamoyladenosine biosynthesis protein TsaB